MKKLIRLIIPIILLTFIIFPGRQQVKAFEITSLNVTEKTDGISVSGTAQEGTLAVVIAVYDEAGQNLVKMVTTSVDDLNAYSDTILMDKGKYIVKVADYEGGNFVTKSVTVGSTENKDEGNNNQGNNKNDDENTSEDTGSDNKDSTSDDKNTVSSNSESQVKEESNDTESVVSDSQSNALINPNTEDNISLFFIMIVSLGLGMFTIFKINQFKKSIKDHKVMWYNKDRQIKLPVFV